MLSEISTAPWALCWVFGSKDCKRDPDTKIKMFDIFSKLQNRSWQIFTKSNTECILANALLKNHYYFLCESCWKEYYLNVFICV